MCGNGSGGGLRLAEPSPYLTIPLTQGQVALVDEADYEDLAQHKGFDTTLERTPRQSKQR